VGHYRVAQICKNGHVINTSADKYPENNEVYCSKYGAPTIMHCEKCGAPIRGYYEIPNVINLTFSYKRPSFCYNCGSPYPWTESAINAAKELAKTFNLDPKEIEKLQENLEDLIKETPRKKVAEINFKAIMKKIGSDGYIAMRDILVNILSETIRKSLFGNCLYQISRPDEEKREYG
jgi:hypothetical protein